MPRMLPLRQRVAVDGDEEVAAGHVGEAGALLQANEPVGLAGEDDLEALLGQDGAELLGDGQRDVLLAGAVGADGAGVVAAVAGIDDHPAELEAELLGEGDLARGALLDRPEPLPHLRRRGEGEDGTGVGAGCSRRGGGARARQRWTRGALRRPVGSGRGRVLVVGVGRRLACGVPVVRGRLRRGDLLQPVGRLDGMRGGLPDGERRARLGSSRGGARLAGAGGRDPLAVGGGALPGCRGRRPRLVARGVPCRRGARVGRGLAAGDGLALPERGSQDLEAGRLHFPSGAVPRQQQPAGGLWLLALEVRAGQGERGVVGERVPRIGFEEGPVVLHRGGGVLGEEADRAEVGEELGGVEERVRGAAALRVLLRDGLEAVGDGEPAVAELPALRVLLQCVVALASGLVGLFRRVGSGERRQREGHRWQGPAGGWESRRQSCEPGPIHRANFRSPACSRSVCVLRHTAGRARHGASDVSSGHC